MPGKAGLVGEHVEVIVEHLHALGGVFDDDAARAVADDPVQIRDGHLVAERLADDGDIAELCLDLVDSRVLGGDPQRELEGGDIRLALDGPFLVVRVSGEVQTGNREAALIRAVKVQRCARRRDAHADDGVVDSVCRAEQRDDLGVCRCDDDVLAIRAAPVKVAGKVEIALSV